MKIFLSIFFIFFCDSVAYTQPPKQKLVMFPVAYYTPETSAGFGGVFIFNLNKEAEGKVSNILTTFSYTVKQQSIFILSPRLFRREGRVEIYSNLRYFFYPSEYYGRGNETLKSDKEKFTENIFGLDFGVKHKFWGDFFFAPHAGYQKHRVSKYETDKKVQSEIEQGFGDFEQRSIGLNFGFDTRDYNNAPLSGHYYFIQFSRHWNKDANNRISSHVYNQFVLDLRNYISLGEKQTLATNFKIVEQEGTAIPFVFLQRLGGGGGALRGYLAGRFRDKSAAIVQTEFRKDFHEKWAWAAFAGVGVVAPNTDTLLKNRRRHSIGGGIHYIIDSESRQKIRLDFGLGENDRGVYFVFGEAF